MTEEMTMYGIRLEDYSSPRFEGKTTLYCGSKEEVERLLGNLEEKNWVKARYASMLQAFQHPNQKQYSLFDKTYPTKHLLRMLYAQEDFFAGHIWEYNADDGSIYHLYAKQMIVSRILARDSEYIYRFIRARITDLEVNIQGRGWVKLKDQFQGFPGVYSFVDDQHIMNLYICNDVYEVCNEDTAFRQIKEMDDDEELEFITKDLLAEGLV